jgi:hypothetical protein
LDWWGCCRLEELILFCPQNSFSENSKIFLSLQKTSYTIYYINILFLTLLNFMLSELILCHVILMIFHHKKSWVWTHCLPLPNKVSCNMSHVSSYSWVHYFCPGFTEPLSYYLCFHTQLGEKKKTNLIPVLSFWVTWITSVSHYACSSILQPFYCVWWH